MRYFVTGGTGFIGGRLIEHLRGAGHEVVALVRDPSKARHLADLGATLAHGDITDRHSLVEPMRGADGVGHVAAWYEVGTDGGLAEAVNVEGTRNVLETMRELGVPRGVYTSSIAGNSDTGGRVVDESYRYDGPHLSRYDATKARAHHEVALPLIAQGLPLVVVMPGMVYGPGDTSQLGRLLRHALAGERILLPGPPTGVCWTHLDDVVHAHVLAMDRGRFGRASIVTGECRTWREGFETAARVTATRLRAVWVPPIVLRALAAATRVIERVVRVPPEYTSEALRVGAGTTSYGDASRAREELGLETRSLEGGLRETFARP
jgi:dihydroflavonol-4-reductase